MKRASLSVEWPEQAMIERNWIEEYVAEQMGVEVKTVQRWKRGENRPHPRQFYRLCKLFGRPLCYISQLRMVEIEDHFIPARSLFSLIST